MRLVLQASKPTVSGSGRYYSFSEEVDDSTSMNGFEHYLLFFIRVGSDWLWSTEAELIQLAHLHVSWCIG